MIFTGKRALLLVSLALAAACESSKPDLGLPLPMNILQDFERGAAGQSPESRDCTMAGFAGLKPGDAGVACDSIGLTARGCTSAFACDGCRNAGVCPEILLHRQDQQPLPREVGGDAYVRLHYSLDKAEICSDPSSGQTFAGFVFFQGHTSGAPNRCSADQPPLDLRPYASVSMQVRAGDDLTSAELALQDAQLETNAKVLIATGPKFPRGQWTEVRVDICDLLLVEGVPRLQRDSIRAVVMLFARDHFMRSGNYLPGLRHMDLDRIALLPCPAGGCPACAAKAR